MKPTRKALQSSAAAALKNVESLLRESDDADDQLGAHAADADKKLAGELARRKLGPAGNDPDAEAEYLYLLSHRRRTRQVQAVAEKAKAAR